MMLILKIISILSILIYLVYLIRGAVGFSKTNYFESTSSPNKTTTCIIICARNEENTIERASRFNIGENRFLITCCAEDLVVHKAFANRINDWADLDRILMRQRGKLNFELIWRELRPLRRHSFQPLWDRRAYIQHKRYFWDNRYHKSPRRT